MDATQSVHTQLASGCPNSTSTHHYDSPRYAHPDFFPFVSFIHFLSNRLGDYACEHRFDTFSGLYETS